MTPYLGQISAFGFNFAPLGWMQCNGQLLSISQYSALFSLLGTTYGGNGTTTFALPDLRGRTGLNQGQGPGLSNYVMGQASGSETVTLLVTQLPAHTHIVGASTATVGASPTNSVCAPAVASSDGSPVNMYDTTPSDTMAPGMLTQAGGSQPHQNMQPFLVINWCIAMEGIFPSRN